MESSRVTAGGSHACQRRWCACFWPWCPPSCSTVERLRREPAACCSGNRWRLGSDGLHPCDGLDTSLCMLPFPNDFYTVADRGTPTGRRVVIPAGAFPDSTTGRRFDPSPWEHNDGFSPGSTILVHVPGLSLAESHVATIGDMGASLARSSPIVLVDAWTGAWWPTWANWTARRPEPRNATARHPPGTEPDRRRSLHRRLAGLEELPTYGDPAWTDLLCRARARGLRRRWGT